MRRFVLRRMHPHRCRPHGQGLLSCTKASGFTCTHGGIASRSARDRPMHEVGRFDSRFLFFQSSLFRPRTVWNRDVRFLSISRRGMRRIVSLRSPFRLDLFLCGCGSRSPRPPLSSLRRTRTSRTTTYPQASFPGSPVHGIFSFLFFFIFLFPTRSYRFLPPLLPHPFLLRGCEGASAPGPGPGRTPPPSSARLPPYVQRGCVCSLSWVQVVLLQGTGKPRDEATNPKGKELDVRSSSCRGGASGALQVRHERWRWETLRRCWDGNRAEKGTHGSRHVKCVARRMGWTGNGRVPPGPTPPATMDTLRRRMNETTRGATMRWKESKTDVLTMGHGTET